MRQIQKLTYSCEKNTTNIKPIKLIGGTVTVFFFNKRKIKQQTSTQKDTKLRIPQNYKPNAASALRLLQL